MNPPEFFVFFIKTFSVPNSSPGIFAERHTLASEIINIRPRIQLYAIGNSSLKTNTEMHIPHILHFKISCKRHAGIGSRGIIRKVVKVIGPLNKGTDSQYFVHRQKTPGPQSAKKLPVFLEIVVRNYRSGIAGTEKIGIFKSDTPIRPIYFPAIITAISHLGINFILPNGYSEPFLNLPHDTNNQ